MRYTANVASSVIFVSELDRSVRFYSEVFGCETALREYDGALLLAPDGFQIYLIAKGDRAPRHTGGIGDQHLMWATDDAEGLTQFEDVLKKLDSYTDTHTGGCDVRAGSRPGRNPRRHRSPQPCATASFGPGGAPLQLIAQ